MALNLTNLWRAIKKTIPYLIDAPLATTINTVNNSPRLKQWITNFMWWVNDTMNLPAYAIGKIWAYYSPEWSQAQKDFNLLAQSSRQASDMGQDYSSTSYALWRLAPVVAAAPLAPAATAPASAWTLSAVETAWLMAPALAWQETFWVWLPSWETNRREAMRQQDLANQRNLNRKQQIANALSEWYKQWINFNSPSIRPLIQQIIQEYNSL